VRVHLDMTQQTFIDSQDSLEDLIDQLDNLTRKEA
jgi:hypothetical protein